MFNVFNQNAEAGDLWGVRICAVLVLFGAVIAALGSVVFSVITFLAAEQHKFADCLKLFFLFLCCLTLAYALLRVGIGLFHGHRFARLGGIAWGVLLLLFCWMLAHDAREPYNPRAPDAQELDGPFFLLAAPTALWLIGYLSARRVSTKFLKPPQQT